RGAGPAATAALFAAAFMSAVGALLTVLAGRGSALWMSVITYWIVGWNIAMPVLSFLSVTAAGWLTFNTGLDDRVNFYAFAPFCWAVPVASVALLVSTPVEGPPGAAAPLRTYSSTVSLDYRGRAVVSVGALFGLSVAGIVVCTGCLFVRSWRLCR